MGHQQSNRRNILYLWLLATSRGLGCSPSPHLASFPPNVRYNTVITPFQNVIQLLIETSVIVTTITPRNNTYATFLQTSPYTCLEFLAVTYTQSEANLFRITFNLGTIHSTTRREDWRNFGQLTFMYLLKYFLQTSAWQICDHKTNCLLQLT